MRQADAAARLARPLPRAPTTGAVRPASIVIAGGTLTLGLHDTYFRTEYARLRQQMLDCHPDRRELTRVGIGSGGRLTDDLHHLKFPHSTGAWRKARQVLAGFFATEDRWYAPTGWGAPVVARYGLTQTSPTDRTRKLLTV